MKFAKRGHGTPAASAAPTTPTNLPTAEELRHRITEIRKEFAALAQSRSEYALTALSGHEPAMQAIKSIDARAAILSSEETTIKDGLSALRNKEREVRASRIDWQRLEIMFRSRILDLRESLAFNVSRNAYKDWSAGVLAEYLKQVEPMTVARELAESATPKAEMVFWENTASPTEIERAKAQQQSLNAERAQRVEANAQKLVSMVKLPPMPPNLAQLIEASK